MPEWLAWSVIKPLLLKMLPGALAVVAIIGAVWWINHEGYQRAMTDRDAADAKMLVKIRDDLRVHEARLAVSIASVAGQYQGQHDALAAAGVRLRPIILQESKNAPRLSDPAAGLTPGLLAAVNQARSLGPCAAAPSGRIECALPAAASGH
jgi:hypothetical protein